MNRRRLLAQLAAGETVTVNPSSPPDSPPSNSSGKSDPLSPPSRPTAIGAFTTAAGQPAPLEDLYRGASLFLVLSGPSLRTLDLSQLSRRGIITMGVNNSPTIIRPHLWTYVDRTWKFHDAIWRDPGVLKFIPARHLENNLRHKNSDGRFIFLQHKDGSLFRAKEMPGVFGYRRNSWYDRDHWLSEPTVNWGNSRKSARKNKRPRILNVMLAALKISYLLGFRRVYLLGADFNMLPEQPYAFGQRKNALQVQRNNHTYQLLAKIFAELKPSFDAADFKIFNCTPSSCLQTFEHIAYPLALAEATRDVPQDPLDAAGWYDL